MNICEIIIVALASIFGWKIWDEVVDYVDELQNKLNNKTYNILKWIVSVSMFFMIFYFILSIIFYSILH